MSAGEGAGFVRALTLAPVADDAPPRAGHPWDLPVVAALGRTGGIALHPQVTYLVGENGSGKSTLLEALAVAAGMNPEGGSSNFRFSTRASHSSLGESLSLVRGARRPRGDFFLRAESLFTAATYLDGLDDARALDAYGGRSLHEQSHGESFLAVLLHRLGAGGLYLLDEPEAALSVQNQLTCLRQIDELVRAGSQFVIATHAPVVLAWPGALILELSADAPPQPIDYEDAEPVRLTGAFLRDRGRFLDGLLGD